MYCEPEAISGGGYEQQSTTFLRFSKEIINCLKLEYVIYSQVENTRSFPNPRQPMSEQTLSHAPDSRHWSSQGSKQITVL